MGTSPAGELSALAAAPSAEPVRPTETAEPTPGAGAAEPSGDGEPSAQPFAWTRTGFAAVALAFAVLPFGIRLRRELRKRAEDEPSAVAPTRASAADRYEILEEVGRGGMAVVYRARDRRLGRVVALKRIADNLREHPQAVDMLLREARNAARLNHPNIVTVYDVDQDDDSYFITMEFLEGKALLGVLQRRGRFAPKRVVWLAKQVAAGLAYAHERGVVHRDIKTANLFFVVSTQTLKIMDFGLARIVEEVRRRATVIGGTPSYMSPEQSQGLVVDGRADLYAFGVTLFELLTGTLPFQEGDLAEQHRSAPVPDPRERAVGLPDALAELVLHLLAKRSEDRPASAGEVFAKLRQIEGAFS